VTPLEEHLPYALRQFETEVLVPIHVFGYDLSFTDASLAKFTTGALLVVYMTWAMRERALVPRRLQASAEALYGFVVDTVQRVAGPQGRPAVPFIFTVFVFVLIGTLLGLLPFKETFTSHLATTLALSFTVFAYVNVIAFRTHGLGFLRFFLPAGVPLFIAPILVLVELISYLFRPITLGFRIFANIFAGHVMVKLFADFCVMLIDALGGVGFAAALAPLAVMVVLYGFEIGIICIQAYIFMLIATMYLRDALRGH
jgi:F-type H+-transporting ATPase subunit a